MLLGVTLLSQSNIPKGAEATFLDLSTELAYRYRRIGRLKIDVLQDGHGRLRVKVWREGRESEVLGESAADIQFKSFSPLRTTFRMNHPELVYHQRVPIKSAIRVALKLMYSSRMQTPISVSISQDRSDYRFGWGDQHAGYVTVNKRTGIMYFYPGG